jgi:hypothetical protein
MANEECECIIGLLHHNYDSSLVTLESLREHITDGIMYNNMLDSDLVLKDCKELRRKVWTLAEYADGRRSTNLQRFHNCPMCGKTIDWHKIRRLEDGK